MQASGKVNSIQWKGLFIPIDAVIEKKIISIYGLKNQFFKACVQKADLMEW
jgi:hypothetical protein